jgi:hypothetical protein
LSNVEDKNKYSFKVDSSGGKWRIYLVVSGSVQFYDQQNRPFLFSFVIAVMVSFPNWV